MRADPPVYDVDPDDLDDDQHPTAAWTVGENLDEATKAQLTAFMERNR